MQIRKFKGETMSGVLRRIHEELGPDAVILLTQEEKGPWRKGLSRRTIEVTAATDGVQFQGKPGEKKEEKKPIEKEEKKEAAVFGQYLETAIQGDIHRELQSIKGQLAELRSRGRTDDAPPAGKAHETWLEMKTVLKALTASRYEDPYFSSHQSVFELFQKLRAGGIDSEMAKSLCHGVKAQLAPDDLQNPGKLEKVLKERLAASIAVTGGFKGLASLSAEAAPKALALVGPTGVGKSTTLAKIAARQSHRKQKVTLIAFDAQNAGDEDRLMRFARHLDIPALTADSIGRLKSMLAGRRGDELILIDTVGCSHLDRNGLALLRHLSDARMPVETHLVLSANTKASDMSDMIDGFSALPIDSLLFTKIDETRRYGPLFSVLGRKRKPVSFLTAGRRVPEDIEAATPQRFCELVLQGE